MKSTVLSLAVLLSLVAAPANADAPCGAVLCLSELSAEDADRVIDIVADAREQHPMAFDGVARLYAAMPELEATKRGRLAVVGPALTALGDDVIPAILERLVLADPGSKDLTPSALAAWRIGLLDAAGKLRDPRTARILEAVCRNPRVDTGILTAAAAALGRLETDSAATVLVELSRQPNDRGRAVLAGMGHCRRLTVVQRLAEALNVQSDGAAHREVARSLATAASGPVWRAGLAQNPDEGPEIRAIAARALLDDFIVRSELERPALVTAILVVDHPTTPEMIENERATADPGTLVALDYLERRVEDNPVGRMATPQG